MQFFPLVSAAFLAMTTPALAQKDYNAYVLKAVSQMPDGGRYSKLDDATEALGRSIWVDQAGKIAHDPLIARPVYCSGATYEVFVTVIRRLQEEGLELSPEAVRGLLVNMQPDGHDTWGRWNANGPGTSRLFYELGLGMNTMERKDAKPGDFLKIFFNQHIGKFERGHSVVYLGSLRKNGVDHLRYWSSDAPGGRGIKDIPWSRVVRAIFSRLQHPENLNRIPSMPVVDPYLASMLTKESSLAEMREKIGLRP